MSVVDGLLCLGRPFVSVRSSSCSASFWRGYQKACIETKADSYSGHSQYAADNSCSPGKYVGLRKVSFVKYCC